MPSSGGSVELISSKHREIGPAHSRFLVTVSFILSPLHPLNDLRPRPFLLLRTSWAGGMVPGYSSLGAGLLMDVKQGRSGPPPQ